MQYFIAFLKVFAFCEKSHENLFRATQKRSRDPLGPLLEPLGDPLGRCFGASWAFWGRSWAPKWRPGAYFGFLQGVQEGPEGVPKKEKKEFKVRGEKIILNFPCKNT